MEIFGFLKRTHLVALMLGCLSVGLFVQLSGKVWIESGSARNTQVYLWLLLPAFIFILSARFFGCGRVLDKTYLPWVLFISWVAVSAYWATGADRDPSSLAKRGVFVLLYLVAIRAFLLLNEELLRKVILAAVIMVALGALISLINQFVILEQPLAYRAFRIDRAGIGDFANYGWPVAAGIFHGAVSLWALGVALDKRTTLKASLFWLCVFVVLSVYVYFTFTRGAWFSLIAGFVFVVVFQNSKRGWGALALGGALSIVALVAYWSQLVVEFEDKQLSGRGYIWVHYFDVMKGHWLLGHGLGTPFAYHWPGSTAISPHAHSLYLQQIYDSGLVSLFLLLLGLFALLIKIWRFRTDRWIALASPPLVFALVSMITDVERIFTRPGDYWTVFWLPVALILGVNHMRQTMGGVESRRLSNS